MKALVSAEIEAYATAHSMERIRIVPCAACGNASANGLSADAWSDPWKVPF